MDKKDIAAAAALHSTRLLKDKISRDYILSREGAIKY